MTQHPETEQTGKTGKSGGFRATVLTQLWLESDIALTYDSPLVEILPVHRNRSGQYAGI
jgi:hypothetical protein